jgi:DNA-binding NtrC family response regulator
MEKKRILIVDDDPLICKMLKRCIDFYFKDKDVKVSYVGSTQECLSNLEKYSDKYNLVITDWNCSEENSGMKIVTCAQFRFGISVIVYTGDTLLAKRVLDNKYREMGIYCPVVDKSDDISKLMEVINGIIIRR